MSWLRDISRAVAKDFMREQKRRKETVIQSEGQTQTDTLGKELGEELIFVETLTQEEYDAMMPPEQLAANAQYAQDQKNTEGSSEQENILQMMKNEGERTLVRLDALIQSFEDGEMDKNELSEEMKWMEQVLSDHFFIHSDPFQRLSIERIQSLHWEYQRSFVETRRRYLLA